MKFWNWLNSSRHWVIVTLIFAGSWYLWYTHKGFLTYILYWPIALIFFYKMGYIMLPLGIDAIMRLPKRKKK